MLGVSHRGYFSVVEGYFAGEGVWPPRKVTAAHIAEGGVGFLRLCLSRAFAEVRGGRVVGLCNFLPWFFGGY